MAVIYPVFFLSGFAALVYQVVWQRALFEIYGINSESVAMVVTVFMLGLGLGSLAGGALSRGVRRSPLAWFAFAELGIGVFGFFSLGLIHAVGALTLRLPPFGAGLAAFGLMLVPTVLMGATLPLLVAEGVRLSGNVGRSLGTLYAMNTFGSAVASLAASVWMLGVLGQAGSTRAAALLNLVVGLAALGGYVRTPGR